MSMRHNNNPTDNKSFLEFKRRQQELIKQTEDLARRMKIESNLEKWESNLLGVLKLAKPNILPKGVIEKIKLTPLKPPYNKQTIITAKNPNAATFVAYAVIYGLIQAGIAIPSQIKKTSLIDGYNNINGMFQSRKWKDYFFNPEATVLLIEGASKSLAYMGQRGEEQFWKELNDFTRSGDKLVIITYASDEEEQKKGIFVPVLSGDSDLNRILVKKSVFAQISLEEEQEIEVKQKETY